MKQRMKVNLDMDNNPVFIWDDTSFSFRSLSIFKSKACSLSQFGSWHEWKKSESSLVAKLLAILSAKPVAKSLPSQPVTCCQVRRMEASCSGIQMIFPHQPNPITSFYYAVLKHIPAIVRDIWPHFQFSMYFE